jgi:hypothetical protein
MKAIFNAAVVLVFAGVPLLIAQTRAGFSPRSSGSRDSRDFRSLS